MDLICSATRAATVPVGTAWLWLRVEAGRDFLPVVVRRRVCPRTFEAVKPIRQIRTIIEMRFKRVSLLCAAKAIRFHFPGEIDPCVSQAKMQGGCQSSLAPEV